MSRVLPSTGTATLTTLVTMGSLTAKNHHVASAFQMKKPGSAYG